MEVIVSAKTVDEAVALGAKQLGKLLSEVTYEVLEEGKKGFLGMMSKEASVKVIAKETIQDKIVDFLNSLVNDMGVQASAKVVKIGELPIDVGCVVSNSSTIAEIGKYLKTGMPLIERCITVDGNIVKEPKNVIAPIGTPLEDVFEFCGGFTDEPKKVLYGGPMMGITVPYLTVPVLKNTNAILAFSRNEAKVPKATACIKCNACANACPFGINPIVAAKALKTEDLAGLEKSGIELCMSCGCCSFACPAKRPIVQNNKIAKETLEVYAPIAHRPLWHRHRR